MIPLERMNDVNSLLKKVALAVVAIAVFLGSTLSLPQTAAAYPIFAQQGFENPREATGRIVCANCHLAKKPSEVEVPQSVLPDSVFEAIVKIPYDTSKQQAVGSGEKGPLNVGAVLMLPEGFTLAPEDRIPEELREEVSETFIQPYSEAHPNWLVVGPLPGEQYQEIKFPILSPDPKTDSAIKFGKYQIHLGANRGRGQIYPNGSKSNNNVFNASVAGTISQVEKLDYGGYEVTIQKADGESVVDEIPGGPELIVSEGQEVAVGTPLTENPNVGGFGQADVEVVLQDPNRILGLLAFFASVTLFQIFLVLKKKQVERVQAAEMQF